jgi:uncharacterized protein YecT (DUF1311 family)
MKQLKIILTIFSLTILTSAASAQTQLQMNEQAGNSYTKAEQELNDIYQKILKEYSADTSFISRLKAAERLWIKFRDAELEMRFPPGPDKYYGSVLPMCKMGYLEKLTRDRIKTLKVWTEGIKEGDACNGSVKIKH